MTEMHMKYLIIRYPVLKHFIERCFETKQFDELCEFLMNIETD